MAAELKIKQEFHKRRLAFGKSANPLYKRSGDELIDLAIMALTSKDPSLLQLFEGELPPLIELKKTKSLNQLKNLAAGKK
ncbi:MAG TPA: hypothetical protein VN457_07875 [Chlamydiales bacterium]|nr:hypothetical protein [Chlamydiales bacterium]